ncbi:MAG: hypothetical protein IT374_11370 [Polyangiaceae bacterium]|nr:hypothetical protein [Polyangiaceae bacterium]
MSSSSRLGFGSWLLLAFTAALCACGGDDEQSPTQAATAGSGGGTAGGAGKAGSNGATAGSAGATAGSAGATAGSAGATAGSAGATAGSAGSTAGSAGSTAGSAGATAGSGGAAAGSGGSTAGTGGSTAGSGGSAGGSGGSAGGQSASANISAASGGKLVVGGATLLFGPKVVAADLTVTGSSGDVASGTPRSSELRGKVYEFGPSGTKFDKAVLIRLPLPGSVPSGKQWNVAWLDAAAGKWVPLPTVITSEGAVSMTNHFTQFTLLEQPLLDVSGGCNVAAPCGGALGSHYDLGAACFTGNPPMSGPLPFCATGSLSQAEAHTTGIFDFDDATKGVYQAIVLGLFTRMDLEPACLGAITAITGPVTKCTDLEASLGSAFKASLFCGGDPASKCTCFAPSTFAESIHTGTYSTNGNTLTLTDAKGSVDTDYCVSGGVLDVDDGGTYEFKFTP